MENQYLKGNSFEHILGGKRVLIRYTRVPNNLGGKSVTFQVIGFYGNRELTKIEHQGIIKRIIS